LTQKYQSVTAQEKSAAQKNGKLPLGSAGAAGTRYGQNAEISNKRLQYPLN
jgi:hypothetical protein